MINLLLQRRFLSFFICQFLGALSDSTFRLALVAMLSFGALKSDNAGIHIQLAAALFMLPFLLFSAVAGDIADAIGKRAMLRISKAAECAIMTLAACALYWQNLALILFCLFLTGIQSAFFGPVKYALLPSLLNKRELLHGNALFSASTFAAILLGTITGTIAGQTPTVTTALSAGLIALSVFGLITAWLVPKITGDDRQNAAAFRPWKSCKTVLTLVHGNTRIFRLVLAGSWFWLVGALLLNELPHLGKTLYHESLTAVFIGVSIGAAGCRLLYGNSISTKYAPVLLLIGGGLLLDISHSFTTQTASPRFWATLVLFAAVMTCYVVPLRAAIQAEAKYALRARIIAGYNIYNALFIIAATLLAAALHANSDKTASNTVLQTSGLLTLAAVIPTCFLLPLESLRNFLRLLCRLLFRVKVFGEENLDDNNATIICNHRSFLDALLLAVFLEKPPARQLCFAIDVEQMKRPLFRPLIRLVTAFALNPMEPHGVRALIKEIKKNDGLQPMIFPEGRITTTGGLMKIYPGASIIATQISDGNIVPIHISGAEFSHLSKMQGKLKLRWFPKIHIYIGKKTKILPPAHLGSQQQRKWMVNRVHKILEDTAFLSRSTDTNLTRTFADGTHQHGSNSVLFAEIPKTHLSRRLSYRAAVAIGATIRARHDKNSTPIGVLLPTSVGAAVVFWGGIFHHLVPVMLNPSAGKRQVLSACRTAQITTVYTSEKLLALSPPTAEIVAELREQGMEILTLEALRQTITLPTKLRALWAGWFPSQTAKRLPGFAANPDSAACILFTSGSEGAPKGVVLSHRNLIGNAWQILSRLDITNADTITNTLPIFHSFGLTVGVVLPAIVGVKAWQYPSPLHYRLIPELLYDTKATIFFSTDSFLQQYGLVAHPLDFHNLRLVFAGAEKLKKHTRQFWLEKFGIRILEGYGLTETSPVLAISTPAHCKDKTVGRILPGIETQLSPVDGVQIGGRLLVRGVNVMRGYYLADAPGVLQPPPDGWHDTGDIVDIDEDGYATILGRAKRFVKIAGEMAPLDGIEERLKSHWPDAAFAVVGLVDERRGETLALMTTASVSREEISQALRQDGLPDLWTPRILLTVKELPLLPTGKINYPAVAEALNQKSSQ